MHYSNLRNEAEVPEPRVDPGSSAAKLSLGPGDDLFKKRESYWFLALVVVLVLIGSIVFYCAHTGGSGYPVSAGYSYTEPAPAPPPTPASSNPRATVLLHTDAEFEYYKVAVDNGTRLTEGKVSETCEAAGMRAVCSGPSSCKYTNVAKCVITPLSSNCNNPMYPLSKILCNNNKPRNCDKFEGVFSFMNNWYGGECGRVGYDWCANGDDFVAGTLQAGPGRSQGDVETYYGYCAKQLKN